MNALEDVVAVRDAAPLDEQIECPLHVAARELAQAAVMQHVLFLEGECQPRAPLSEAIMAWADLYQFIRGSVCPASRWAPLDAEELDMMTRRMLGRLPAPTDPARIERLRHALSLCASCPASALCPSGLDPL